MKKVYHISTKSLMSVTFNWYVFADDMKSAIGKIEKVKDNDHQILNAELYCEVEEDEDLAKYLEE